MMLQIVCLQNGVKYSSSPSMMPEQIALTALGRKIVLTFCFYFHCNFRTKTGIPETSCSAAKLCKWVSAGTGGNLLYAESIPGTRTRSPA